MGEHAPGFGRDGVGVDATLFEDGADDALLLVGQGEEQVDGEHHLAFVLFGNGLGLLESLLGFLSEFVDPKHRGPLIKTLPQRQLGPGGAQPDVLLI